MQIEKQSRIETAKRELKEVGAMVRAYLRVDGIWELDKICRIYLRELIDTVRCEECAIMLVDGPRVTVLAGKGHSRAIEAARFITDIPVINHVVNTKCTYSSVETTGSPEEVSVIPGWFANSLICTPIMLKKMVRGVICLASGTKDAFDRETVEFAESMSRELSIAFEQSLQISRMQSVFGEDMLLGCRARCVLSIDLKTEISIARRHKEQVSLLVVGIEKVRRLNGECASERCPKPEMVKRILDILRSNVRAYHKVYVYGPGQFVLLMADTEKEQALIVARRLKKVIERQQREGMTICEDNTVGTVRIGVVAFPSDGDDADRLTELAGSLLRESEESGSNLVRD